MRLIDGNPLPTSASQAERTGFEVRAWVAGSIGCEERELRHMRDIVLAPGVREVRYLRNGNSAVVATVARQQPGRYRIRATWTGGSAEASIRGYLVS